MQKKLEGVCKGCIELDGYVPEWSDSGICKVHECTRLHDVQFCGLCEEFPCSNITKIIHCNRNIIQHMEELKNKFNNK